NFLRLPEPYGSADLSLISFRSEINFSTQLFWTTFLQYNTQQDNFNINSRLQWRFAPMSDVFLVLTDNYAASPFLKINRNRAVVLKVNYWLTF
ncbi:MAG: hydrolase, partial [Cyclobacteriaceae bacterium]